MSEQDVNNSLQGKEVSSLTTPSSPQKLKPTKQQKSNDKYRQAMVAPREGFDWNPLRGLPRNQPCPCQSGRKFKACCLLIQPWVIPKNLADQYREQMKRPNLVFLTRENEARLKAESEKLKAERETQNPSPVPTQDDEVEMTKPTDLDERMGELEK